MNFAKYDPQVYERILAQAFRMRSAKFDPLATKHSGPCLKNVVLGNINYLLEALENATELTHFTHFIII